MNESGVGRESEVHGGYVSSERIAAGKVKCHGLKQPFCCLQENVVSVVSFWPLGPVGFDQFLSSREPFLPPRAQGGMRAGLTRPGHDWLTWHFDPLNPWGYHWDSCCQLHQWEREGWEGLGRRAKRGGEPAGLSG